MKEDHIDFERRLQEKTTLNEILTKQVASLNEVTFISLVAAFLFFSIRLSSCRLQELFEQGREKLALLKLRSELENTVCDLTQKNATQKEQLNGHQRSNSNACQLTEELTRFFVFLFLSFPVSFSFLQCPFMYRLRLENDSLMRELSDQREKSLLLDSEKSDLSGKLMSAQDKALLTESSLNNTQQELDEALSGLFLVPLILLRHLFTFTCGLSELQALRISLSSSLSENKSMEEELARASSLLRESEKTLSVELSEKEEATKLLAISQSSLFNYENRVETTERENEMLKESKNALGNLVHQLRAEVETFKQVLPFSLSSLWCFLIFWTSLPSTPPSIHPSEL